LARIEVSKDRKNLELASSKVNDAIVRSTLLCSDMKDSESQLANAKRKLEEVQNKVVTAMKEVLVAKQERAEAES
jgi:hypothetical protein